MSHIIAPADEVYQRANVGYQTRTKPSFGFALGAIGDSVTIQFKMREQVDSFTDAFIEVTGTSATRSYEAEFRWGTDGSTWTSWLAFTTYMLDNQMPDKNNPLYFEIRVTRTGTDTAGVLLWTFAAYTSYVNDQATVGRGLPSQENIHGDTIALFKAIIESWVWKYGGANHYEVEYKPRDWEFSTVKPTIYMHSLTQAGLDRESLCSYGRLAQISIGVKPVKGKTDGYNEQLSRLLSMFDPLNAGAVKWTFDYKGVRYIDATLADVGLRINSISGMQEFHDHDTYLVYNEFVVMFSINFGNIAHY